jgi:hypothetical protein
MFSLERTTEAVAAPPAGEQPPTHTRPAGVPFWRMLAVHAVLDDENRPLGEHRAPRDLEGAAPTQLKPCSYAGSRHRHPLPMNVSGLRQVSQHWDDVAAGLAFLHHAFRDRASPLTLPQLWRLLAATAVLPSYLLHRAGPGRGSYRPQAFVAAMYKASLGIKFMLEKLLLENLMAGRPLDGAADASSLSSLSESSGVLVGLEQVCAAPANMIADTLRALVEGGEPRAAQRSALAAIVGPPGPLRAFTRAACDLYSTLLVFATLGARVQAALEKELAVPVSPPRESGPLVPGMSLEMNLSVTLGMRRICWPLARLDEARCLARLKACCDITSGENDPRSAAAVLLAVPRCADAATSVDTVARQLERELTQRFDGGRTPASLPNISALLASYARLESAVYTRIRHVEQQLNDALGRGCTDGGTAPVPAGYCAVAAWTTATNGLGVPIASDPVSGTIRCGERSISVDPGVDHACS